MDSKWYEATKKEMESVQNFVQTQNIMLECVKIFVQIQNRQSLSDFYQYPSVHTPKPILKIFQILKFKKKASQIVQMTLF